MYKVHETCYGKTMQISYLTSLNLHILPQGMTFFFLDKPILGGKPRLLFIC